MKQFKEDISRFTEMEITDEEILRGLSQRLIERNEKEFNEKDPMAKEVMQTGTRII
jgi:hypothetical protein